MGYSNIVRFWAHAFLAPNILIVNTNNANIFFIFRCVVTQLSKLISKITLNAPLIKIWAEKFFINQKKFLQNHSRCHRGKCYFCTMNTIIVYFEYFTNGEIGSDKYRFSAQTDAIHKMEELKFMVWRYFMSYWSNRRICSAIGGIPPAVKRQRFYAAVAVARFAS